MAGRIRWGDRLFDGKHLTILGASVCMGEDAAPRTQARMQRHVDSCGKCADLIEKINGTINLARIALLGGTRVAR